MITSFLVRLDFYLLWGIFVGEVATVISYRERENIIDYWRFTIELRSNS